MAFIGLIACIRSALDDVESMLKDLPVHANLEFKTVKFMLKYLETFVLFAGMMGSDGNLASFLLRIDSTIRSKANLSFLQLTSGYNNSGLVCMLQIAIESLRQEIDGWYIIMVNQDNAQVSTTDQISEIIASFLESLSYFQSSIGSSSPQAFPIIFDTMEACKQQILFMKSLTRFVSTRNAVEPLKDLLDHTWAITLNAAYILSRFSHSYKLENYEDLQYQMSVLLQKIESVDSHFYADSIRALSSSKLNSPLLNDDDDDADAMKDFLDSLISNLWDLLRLNTCPSSGKDLQEVYEGLRSLRTILKQQPEIKIKEDTGDVLCDAGVLVCSLHLTHSEVNFALSNFLPLIRSIRAQIEGVKDPQLPESIKKTDVPAVKEEGEETAAKEVMTSQGGEVVVGFHDDQSLIVDQLTRGSPKMQIVAIVGMAGLGKTTLATRVYTNPSISRYFSARAWSPVSQVVDKRKVLLDILGQIDPSKCSETSSVQDLAEKLRKSLKRRRFLIFLDDVWETEAWNTLKESFPNDNVGSRIILTSRRHVVAPVDLMVGEKPYSLRHLNVEESMELLQMKLSDRLSTDLGMKVAQICRGLPLIVVIVAGVLQTTNPEVWNGILDGLRNVSSTDVQCRNALELSYRHMPPYLMPCLLYLGVFKEDYEIPVRRLLRLWMAEGFVQKDAAEGYLKDLIGRSLVMVAKQRSDGGIKTCRIHDLLRSFCIQKAKDEDFFHFLKGYYELSAFNQQDSLQRLCIQSEVQDFKESKLFCPRACSLIFNSSQSQSTQKSYDEFLWVDISSAIQIFKLLTVLDLEQVDLGCRFPTETEQLVQLVFLAIRSDCSEIPSTIGKLCNLETFIMQCRGKVSVSFPESFWILHKLQYLCIKSFFSSYNAYGGGLLPSYNVNHLYVLQELEMISGLVLPLVHVAVVLKMFPNIRKFKCIAQAAGCSSVIIPDSLSRLDSLNILCETKSHVSEFFLPAHVRKLTLGNFRFSPRSLSTIGGLPNLLVLKLLSPEFKNGSTWEMGEGEFPSLEILKLSRSRLIRWFTDSEDLLESFKTLVLDHCSYLEEMPSCLESIATLEVIEVSHCPRKVVNLVTQIEEKREELMGDSNLKIITSNIW